MSARLVKLFDPGGRTEPVTGPPGTSCTYGDEPTSLMVTVEGVLEKETERGTDKSSGECSHRAMGRTLLRIA